MSKFKIDQQVVVVVPSSGNMLRFPMWDQSRKHFVGKVFRVKEISTDQSETSEQTVYKLDGTGGMIFNQFQLSNNFASELVSTTSKYELFQDTTYFDVWCVRSKDDKRFESPMSFHFVKREDAEEFKKLIEIAI